MKYFSGILLAIMMVLTCRVDATGASWQQIDKPGRSVGYTLTIPENTSGVIEEDANGARYLKAGNPQARMVVRMNEKPVIGKTYIFAMRLKPQSWWRMFIDDAGELKRLKIDLDMHQKYNRKFTWPQEVVAAIDIYNNKPSYQLEDIDVELAFAIESDAMLITLNDIMVQRIPVSPDFFNSNLELQISREQKISSVVVLDTPELFHPVDLSLQLNSAGIGAERIQPETFPRPGSDIVVNEVPFKMPVDFAGSGRDNIDLGASYLYQGRYAGWREHRTRWVNGTRLNPARIRFRVPFRRYARLYVLAASDSEKNHGINTFTVQFYRPAEKSGFPKNFKSPEVPLFTQKGDVKKTIEVKTGEDKTRYVHLIEIPVDFSLIEEFSDLHTLDFELTKDIHVFRAYADPFFGTKHGGGLPSAVRIFAMTLQKAPVYVDFKPEKIAGIFHEGEAIGFNATFNNTTDTDQNFTATMQFESYDKVNTGSREVNVHLAPQEHKTETFEFSPERFGHYDIALNYASDDGEWDFNYKRTASHLREREYAQRGFHSKGHMFGYWKWRGTHNTPTIEEEFEIAGRFGLETFALSFDANKFSDQAQDLMKKYKMRGYAAGGTGGIPMQKNEDGKFVLDPEKGPAALDKIKSDILAVKKTEVQDPQFFSIFIEPGGIGTHGTVPNYYNEEFIMTEREKTRYASVREQLMIIAEMVREINPDLTIMMPWGDPVYPVPFLMDDPEVTANVDGLAWDAPLFGRLPEAQVSQNSVPHRTYMFTDTWENRKETKPEMMTIEGPFIWPVSEAYLNPREYAGRIVRTALILSAYGINRQYSAVCIADCASWWGEQHYGASGLIGRKNTYDPHVAASTFGALIRHLRHMEFVGWDDTGSLSVYSVKYRDVRDGSILRILWTLRGSRNITINAANADPKLIDAMDNSIAIDSNNGKVTFPIDDLPVYLYGYGDDVEIELGEPDHSDSNLGDHVAKLGNAADLLRVEKPDGNVDDEDSAYVDAFRAVVRRFPTPMKIEVDETSIPEEYGGKALTVDFDGKPETDRLLMPYYTKLYANTEFPGVPSHISAYVKGSSDWGRLVFVLRDAKGEKWTSVGAKDEWNVDDQPANSFFIFDSWRLIRFPLPGNLPYDNFRTAGSPWWGSTGGDGVVNYPLTLEAVFVERRDKLLYVNSLVDVPNNKPVAIGDIYLEYPSASAMTDEAIEISKIRMELPEVAMSDVYGDLKKSGTLPAGKIHRVEHPPIQEIDGTRGLFFFDEVEGAVGCDFYFSLFPDGQGAMKLATLKQSGERIDGLKANTDIYVFYVYHNEKEEQSLPSPIFNYKLEDLFSQQ